MAQVQNHDPVYELMRVRESLQLMADLLGKDVDPGQANIVGQLARQLDEAVQQLDEEDWQPTRKSS